MNIKKLRKNAGMTQKELATAIGMDRSTVAKWETEGRLPRSVELPKVAKVLGVKIEELFQSDI